MNSNNQSEAEKVIDRMEAMQQAEAEGGFFELVDPPSDKLRTFGIYTFENMGVDTVEAKDSEGALRKYALSNNFTPDQMKGYWAEDLEA